MADFIFDFSERSWWMWLRLPVRAGRQLDGSARYEAVGHRRALSPVWSRSVGLWGGVVPAAVVADCLGHPPKQRYAEFRKFWHVRASVDRKRWGAEVKTVPRYALAELSWDTYHVLRRDHARGDALRACGRTLRVLPVEVAAMLWQMELFLGDLGMTYSMYRRGIADEEREEIWDQWIPTGPKELRAYCGSTPVLSPPRAKSRRHS